MNNYDLHSAVGAIVVIAERGGGRWEGLLSIQKAFWHVVRLDSGLAPE